MNCESCYKLKVVSDSFFEMSKNCTDEQKAAIEASYEDPVAIIACPGSGKTFTIIHRVAYLITHGFSARDILVITFTRKAAMELKQRLKAMGIDVSDLTVRTFHSFGLSVLRKFGHLLNLQNFGIISQAEQLELLGEISGKKVNKDLLLQLQKYKAGCETSEDMKAVFDKYAARLRNVRSCDYTDLIVLPLELMRRNKEVLEFYQRRYKYGLVDEMQDVSRVQFELVKLLFGDLGRLTVVGDDDQTIYGWRGADARLLLDYDTVFANAAIYRLTSCFRCAPHIVRAMSAVINCNKIRVKKSIKSMVTDVPRMKKIVVYGASSLQSEADVVLGDIAKRIGKGSIAVLFRQRKAVQVFSTELKNRNIQAVFADKARFLEAKDVTRVLNILQMCAGLTYNVKLVTSVDVEKILAHLHGNEEIHLAEDINQALKDHLKEMNPEESVQAIASSLNLQGESIAFLVQEAKESNEMSLTDFLDYVRTASGQEQGPSTGVHLSTVHQAKGLEWDFVYVIGATAGRWPSRKTDEGKMEEERRLFYVAMSRARKELTVSCLIHPGPSPFLCEIPEILIDERMEAVEEPRKNPSPPPKQQYSGFQPVSSLRPK